MPDFVVVSVGGRRRDPSGPGRAAAFAVRWFITAAAVWIAAGLVGGITLHGWGSTLAVALILGLLNAYLKPLMVLGSLPALVLTLGVFLILINTALLALTAWIAGKFDSIHFAIDGFWSAFWGAVIISLVSFLLSRIINPAKIARRVG